MKLAISSPLGNPLDPRTWSNAPANLSVALARHGAEIVPIDSSCLLRVEKAALAVGNLVRGYPWNAVGWFEPSRRRRGAYVGNQAQRMGADQVLCTSSLDVPIGTGVRYSIWMDNSWNLLRHSRVAPDFPENALDEVDRLESIALNHATHVLTFSEHVRDDIITHYGVPSGRVTVVGCGSGDLPPFDGEKDYAAGHLLFAAKHLFVDKGGEIVLDALGIIRAHRPQTRLVLVGSNDVVERVRGTPGIDAYGFVPRETLIHFFYEAAMLVQPMLADPWGQVYLEAMKARAVVVALDVAALPELTDNGRLGVLVGEPDPRAIADAVLVTYARAQSELDALTRKAQARALHLYSWEAVGARVATVLGLKNE